MPISFGVLLKGMGIPAEMPLLCRRRKKLIRLWLRSRPSVYECSIQSHSQRLLATCLWHSLRHEEEDFA